MDRIGDGAGGELALCGLAIEAPLLLPPPGAGAVADAALHVVLELQGGGVRLQSSAQGRRCERFVLQTSDGSVTMSVTVH